LETEFLKVIEQLQPKPEYLNLFREIVIDVWRQRQGDAIKLATTLGSRVDTLKAKRQRVIDAFVHEQLIDKSTYQEQVDLLIEEIALVELEIYETKLEELDVEAALNYATNALGNAAMFWTQCSADQKQRFQRVLFPDGLIFNGESNRTAPTCIAFSYLRDISTMDSSLASYGNRTRVAAVKEKQSTVIQRNFAAWIALYRICRTDGNAYWTLNGLAFAVAVNSLRRLLSRS
jgi:hypothetical protein